MRETEQYLNRATRGLWGKARREARLELRGAIEDKLYRYRLLGLSEDDATHAALRDLGDPQAIARELNRVHTLPQAGRAALLAGVATLLGMQAFAQVPTVHAIQNCQPLSPSALKGLSPQQRQTYESFVRSKGGIEGAVAWCRQNAASSLLSLDDLIAALRTAGVQVDELSGVDGYLILSFPGGKVVEGLDLSHSLTAVNGQRYVQKLPLLNLLPLMHGVPLQLTGLVNPVLQIGPAKLQLGTETAPVLATDLYAFPLIEELEAVLKQSAPSASPIKIAVLPESKLTDHPGLRLRVSAPDDALYVTLSNGLLTTPGSAYDAFLLAVRRVQKGLLPVPTAHSPVTGQPPQPHIVNSPAELLQATERKEAALLVYRLDPSDLRNLKLTPVPASQVHLITQP
ncbi:hypothetical protein E5F05_06425 [Deinococcus metallilatus]|uniref:Uncharacterized protein n=1 Tax=Deinococcus metallilatus TaxID=1211322 RepID=A0AAJ5JZ77_9DEIO|nr:permease prefix domain 1-containing protein [Deinococcus metallilatus]MBB5294580.1 hypothetical protein [Deinococcus metallilatus]QBY07623.1 hypothetical protein E5F05_06425 [Deinococcus metallilatus]RXJ14039.1 hypothetical protein ERJ73_05260 [Deinococcus metallilatus]TLK30004.1 hypothetical protein FCS05_05575 [Deinococcus metallilatus]GMA15793.1 hypothetical protein GCM10025871_21240 [Deinococcus metallilatus]